MSEFQFDVFLSYSRHNIDKAKDVKEKLVDRGLSVWFDRSSLFAGAKWEEIVPNAIKQSKFFVVLLSTAMNENRNSYVHKEIAYAIKNRTERTYQTVFIIPLRLDQIAPYEQLSAYHHVDAFPTIDNAISEVLKTIFTIQLSCVTMRLLALT